VDPWGLDNALADPVFDGGYFTLNKIEQDELLKDATLGFGRQLEDDLIEPTAAGLAEQLFAILDGESVLGESGVNAIFDGVAEFGEGHSCPR
jgi:hypothetical protein